MPHARWCPRLPEAALALPGVTRRKPGQRGACVGTGAQGPLTRPAERKQPSLSHRAAGGGCKLRDKERATQRRAQRQ